MSLLKDNDCRNCYHAHDYAGRCGQLEHDPDQFGNDITSICGCTEYVDLERQATIIVKTDRPTKPLGRKAYGSIGHLPGSRLGPGDHKVTEGQERIALEHVRDAKDHIVVTEKLDGSCMAVTKVDGQIIPLGRAGYPAITSPYAQHRLFHDWAMERWEAFNGLLSNGERVVGEWLAQAHGTRYNLKNREPWAIFDIIGVQDEKTVPRLTHNRMAERVGSFGFVTVPLLHDGASVGVNAILRKLRDVGKYSAATEDGAEGAVWRVEREGTVDFLAKYVRPDKVDGCLLPDTDAGKANGTTEEIWNWRPKGDRKTRPWWR